MDARVDFWTKEFVEKLKTTDEYVFYSDQLAVLSHYPELMEKINEYREENFRLQNEYEGDELFDKTEEFTTRYEELLENPVVSDFLQAEAGIVRMVQDINTCLVEGLNFQ